MIYYIIIDIIIKILNEINSKIKTIGKKHKLLSKCKKSADNAIYLNEQNSYN